MLDRNCSSIVNTWISHHLQIIQIWYLHQELSVWPSSKVCYCDLTCYDLEQLGVKCLAETMYITMPYEHNINLFYQVFPKLDIRVSALMYFGFLSTKCALWAHVLALTMVKWQCSQYRVMYVMFKLLYSTKSSHNEKVPFFNLFGSWPWPTKYPHSFDIESAENNSRSYRLLQAFFCHVQVNSP